MTLELLCKVVDNFGDIGVAYRLARSLSELPEPPNLRLVVDDLKSFRALDPAIDPAAGRQLVHGFEVLRWDLPPGSPALASYRDRPPALVVECFACGRPDWLEAMLFGAEAGPSLILDLEHLTAEPYAAEFHRMPSLTRSSRVRKAMFLPGFSAGTGGLIVDRAFAASQEAALRDPSASRRALLSALGEAGAFASAPPPPDAEGRFWISVFSYERDYSRIVAELAALSRSGPFPAGRRGLLALAAAGKSQSCFLEACWAAGMPFPVIALPFLAQETWDKALLSCDFSIVRGEDSWARAALSGRPFVWQAYPQEGRQQMVKVEAFLERLSPYFTGPSFPLVAEPFRAINDRELDLPSRAGTESILPLLRSYDEIKPGFSAFSAALAGREGLAAALVTFLREIV